jgi:heavy metal sensor kinase
MPRYANVRHRLTLWYVSVFGLVLLLFIAGASLLEYWQLSRQLYHAEIQDIETAEGLLGFTADGRLVLHEEYHNHPQSLLLLDRYMEVLTPEGEVLLRNHKLQGQDLGEPPFPGEGLLSYHERRVRLKDGTRLLLISHVHSIDNRPLLIRLAYSSAPIEHGVVQFIGILLLAVPPALLVAGLAGYRMAFKVLVPLEKMALRAETITASHLEQRLPVENPNDELGHMARVLNDLLERLQGSFDNLKRFTADASHELRTPLASIRSVGEVALQRARTPEEYQDTIGSMLEEVTRLTEMVEGLLSMSRADAGQVTLHRTTFRLLDLAQEVVALLGLVAEEKGQRIQIDGDASLLVSADRMVLHRGLANIVENAIKHSPAATGISISIVRSEAGSGDYAEILVEDRGESIPEDLRLKVFERFFRIDASRSREAGGSGLGLAIAKWAIEVNGGSVHLVAGHEGGNCFVVRIPILTGDGTAVENKTDAPAATATDSP